MYISGAYDHLLPFTVAHDHMLQSCYVHCSYSVDLGQLCLLRTMVLSSAQKSSLICSEIQIMIISTVKFNTLKFYST